VLEQIGAKSYILELRATVRIHPVFHTINLRPYHTTTLQHYIHVTTHDDDDEHDVDNISHVKIDNVQGAVEST
jgi:hypothetical protein